MSFFFVRSVSASGTGASELLRGIEYNSLMPPGKKVAVIDFLQSGRCRTPVCRMAWLLFSRPKWHPQQMYFGLDKQVTLVPILVAKGAEYGLASSCEQ